MCVKRFETIKLVESGSVFTKVFQLFGLAVALMKFGYCEILDLLPYSGYEP